MPEISSVTSPAATEFVYEAYMCVYTRIRVHTRVRSEQRYQRSMCKDKQNKTYNINFIQFSIKLLH